MPTRQPIDQAAYRKSLTGKSRPPPDVVATQPPGSVSAFGRTFPLPAALRQVGNVLQNRTRANAPGMFASAGEPLAVGIQRNVEDRYDPRTDVAEIYDPQDAGFIPQVPPQPPEIMVASPLIDMASDEDFSAIPDVTSAQDFTMQPVANELINEQPQQFAFADFEQLTNVPQYPVAPEQAQAAFEPQSFVFQPTNNFDLMNIVPMAQEQAAVEPELVMVEPNFDAAPLRIAEEPAQAAVEPQSVVIEPTYDAALMDMLQMPPPRQAQVDFGIPQEDPTVIEPKLPQARVIDDFYIPREEPTVIEPKLPQARVVDDFYIPREDPAVIEPRYELDPADLQLYESIFAPLAAQEPVAQRQAVEEIMLDPVLLAMLNRELDASLYSDEGMEL